MMRTKIPVILFFFLAPLLSAHYQVAVAQTQDLPNTVADGATLEEIASGFNFTEGPAISSAGDLLFVDNSFRDSYARIHKIDRQGSLTTYRDGPTEAWVNGLAFDTQGRLLACEIFMGRVTRTEPDGRVTVLADSINGNRFNYPNDLVVATDGSIYFTDSYFNWPKPRPQPLNGVYRIAPDGTVSLLANFDQPNGIALSRDETTLFVTNDNPSGLGEIWAFDRQKDGKLANQRLFATAGEVMDGMALDAAGNLYVASFNNPPKTTKNQQKSLPSEGRGIWIFDPYGTPSGFIPTPDQPTNCTLADNTLYVTTRAKVYSIQLDISDTDQTQP